MSGQRTEIYFLHNALTGSGFAQPSNGYAESYHEVNRPGREAFRSVASSAEVKNESSGIIRTSTSRTKLDVFRRFIEILLYSRLCRGCTVMRRITTFRLATDRIYDGGPIRLQYCNIIYYSIILCYVISYHIIYYIILYYIIIPLCYNCLQYSVQ